MLHLHGLPNFRLSEKSQAAYAFLDLGIRDFHRAARHVAELPFVDGAERRDWEERVMDGQGTRAARHALLARLADEHGIPVQLMLGIYEMTPANTSGIEGVLRKFGVDSALDADCHLSYEGERVLLSRTGPIERRQFLREEVITPGQIRAHKHVVYRRYLFAWAGARGMSLGAAWEVRQACIAALAAASRGAR